jgi:hypothetical protein
VDLAALTPIQREHWEDNAADVLRNRCRFIGDSLIVWVRFVFFVTVRWKISFWVPRNSNTRVLGFDEHSPRNCLDCTAKFGAEPFVPAAPQRRLVRYTLQAQLLAERWTTLEILH